MNMPLLCVVGPTGAGKTGAGIALAKALGGEVVNFDSRQIYADFPIITAQPSAGERAECPHRLYGFLPTAEAMTAAAYAELALAEIARVQGRGALPVLVGGTGMYLRWLLTPMAPIPDVPENIRSQVREDCERRGPQALHDDLAVMDPELASRLHPNDRQRIMRGVEVALASGKPLTQWQALTPPPRPFRVLKFGVGLSLDALTPFLLRRIESMLDAGALDEARAAMERNADPAAPGWSGIGCAEVLAHLRGELELEQCKRQWAANTRAYAKRQLTWFRADAEVNWFGPGEHAPLLAVARKFLAQSDAPEA